MEESKKELLFAGMNIFDSDTFKFLEPAKIETPEEANYFISVGSFERTVRRGDIEFYVREYTNSISYIFEGTDSHVTVLSFSRTDVN